MKPLHGYFYDGKTSKQWPGYIEVYDNYACLRLVDESDYSIFEGLDYRTLAAKDLKITTVIGSHDRRLSFETGVIFEPVEPDRFDECFRDFGPSSSAFILHFLERYFAIVFVGIFLIVALGYSCVRWGAPLAADLIASQIPVEVINSVSGGTLNLLDNMMLVPSELTNEEQDRLRQAFFDTFPDATKDGLKVHFRMGGEDIGANAFALPSGDIVFTDEMVHLAKNDEELIGVFAHEWGHVHHKHILRQAVQSGIVAWFFVMLTGDISVGADLITWVPATLAALAYSRDFEREADRFAMEQMQKIDFPPEHLANLLERLMTGSSGDQPTEEIEQSEQMDETKRKAIALLSTHPVTDERVSMLRDKKNQTDKKTN